ncbi:hypothetical protein H0H92_007264 [Tricholoma furcatifolium]|nr:hypothetical protein H0H92_007264 [Tricholoma furcatifolium]
MANERYTEIGRGINTQGNTWRTRVENITGNRGYHYSNRNGSYYYKNPDGSRYYNDGFGNSKYTPPSGEPKTSYGKEE